MEQNACIAGATVAPVPTSVTSGGPSPLILALLFLFLFFTFGGPSPLYFYFYLPTHPHGKSCPVSISISILYIWWPISTLFLFLPADSSTWESCPVSFLSIFQRYHDQYSFFVLDLDFIWFLHIYHIVIYYYVQLAMILSILVG